MNDVKIQWHPGFVAAMDLELAENRENLIYEKEYNLNTKPLEIDLLIIKMEKDVEVRNEIGKIFRKYNLLEYKSPDDGLNIDTVYKVWAYACLYKAGSKTVDGRKASDITVSIVREARPEGLFAYFKEHGIQIENPFRGIYHVLYPVLFPTQVIVSKELDKEAHIWLKSLSGKLGRRDMRKLLEKIEDMGHGADRELADSVLEVSIQANRHIVEELKGDDSMCQALLEIMEPEINELMENAIANIQKEAEAAKKEIETAKKEAAAVKKEAAAVKKEAAAVKKEAAAVKKEAVAAREKDIWSAVKCFRDLGADDQKVRELLVKNYSFTDEEASRYL